MNGTSHFVGLIGEALFEILRPFYIELAFQLRKVAIPLQATFVDLGERVRKNLVFFFF